MRVEVVHNFEGCFSGCPFANIVGIPYSCLMCKCMHLDSKVNDLFEEGESPHPDWCPIYLKEKEEDFLVDVGYYTEAVK